VVSLSQVTTERNALTRWIPVIAGIAIQLCLGTVYIWGVFQPAIVKLFSWPQATAALTFSFVLGVFVCGSTVGGMIQDKLGPRPVIIGGGVMLGIGAFLASFTTAENPWWLWVTYGVIGGFGMGTTYTTIIACCQKWFPDKRGLITGLIVSALGFGGFIFTPVARYLINSRGVLETFVWFAVIFTVVCVIGALFIKNPPAGYKPEGWVPKAAAAGSVGRSYTSSEMLSTPQFYIVTFTLMLAAAAGLMVIPFAKVLGVQGGLSDTVATSGVMIISLFNSFGRLFWGAVSDKLGRKKTVLLLLLIAGTSILFLGAAEKYTILVLIAVVAFAYGGFLGVFPALTADFWGLRNMGMNYGLVLLGFGVAAVASPFVAGYFKDLTGGFGTAFLITSIAAYAGVVLIFFLKPPSTPKAVEKTGVKTAENA
jgi:MFS transporter, OFA family, oxalate/formate antiporter